MLFKDVITLVDLTVPPANSLGDIVEVETTKDVYADTLSVRQTEFYQAQGTGFKPEIMFVVRTCEYSGQPRVRTGGRDYNIIRTYDRKDELTELVCQALVVR